MRIFTHPRPSDVPDQAVELLPATKSETPDPSMAIADHAHCENAKTADARQATL